MNDNKPTFRQQWEDALSPHMLGLVSMGLLFGAGTACVTYGASHALYASLGAGILASVGFWSPQAGRGSSKQIAAAVVQQVNAETDTASGAGDAAP